MRSSESAKSPVMKISLSSSERSGKRNSAATAAAQKANSAGRQRDNAASCAAARAPEAVVAHRAATRPNRPCGRQISTAIITV